MTDGTNRRHLGRILVAKGVISDVQLHHALAFQRLDGRPLGKILVELGIVSQAELDRALDEQPGAAGSEPAPSANTEHAYEKRRRELEAREMAVTLREQELVEREERLAQRERELAAFVAKAQREINPREATG